MISETELSDLLREAGEAISEPRGAGRILQAAGTTTKPDRRRFDAREVVFGSISIAALIALVVVLVVRPTSSPPIASPLVPSPAHRAIVGFGSSSSPSQSIAGSTGLSRSAATNANPTQKSVASTQKIIASGTLSLTVGADKVRDVVDQLRTIASLFGGYVTESNISLAGSDKGGTVVLGVPAAKFQDAIAKAEDLGAVEHLSTSASDVTGQVEDLGARLSALVAARTQLEALLARAGSISALLSVQNQITSVQSQIEELQAQQRVLSNEISYSTLTVVLAPPSVQHVSVGGFSKAWHDAISGFVGGLRSLLANGGVIVFALLLALIIGLIVIFSGRGIWSLVRRHLL